VALVALDLLGQYLFSYPLVGMAYVSVALVV